MNIQKQSAGHKGGLATLAKYGTEFFAINGARGGRPKALTLAEIKESRQLEAAEENENRRMDTPHSQLKSLKMLWANKTGRG